MKKIVLLSLLVCLSLTSAAANNTTRSHDPGEARILIIDTVDYHDPGEAGPRR